MVSDEVWVLAGATTVLMSFRPGIDGRRNRLVGEAYVYGLTRHNEVAQGTQDSFVKIILRVVLQQTGAHVHCSAGQASNPTNPQRCCPSPRRRGRPRTIEKDKCQCLHVHKSASGRSLYLPDILVPHSADLLNVGRALRYILEGVAAEDELVLLRLGDLDVDTRLHRHSPHQLLADKVSGSRELSASLSHEMHRRLIFLILEAPKTFPSLFCPSLFRFLLLPSFHSICPQFFLSLFIFERREATCWLK